MSYDVICNLCDIKMRNFIEVWTNESEKTTKYPYYSSTRKQIYETLFQATQRTLLFFVELHIC